MSLNFMLFEVLNTNVSESPWQAGRRLKIHKISCLVVAYFRTFSSTILMSYAFDRVGLGCFEDFEFTH